MIKKVSIMLIISIMLFACSSTIPENKIPEKKDITITKQKEPIKTCWFILNPPENNDKFIFGTGIGNSEQSADEDAKASVAEFFRTFITTRYREYYESMQINDKEY